MSDFGPVQDLQFSEDPLVYEYLELTERAEHLVCLVLTDEARSVYRWLPWVVHRNIKRCDEARTILALLHKIAERLEEDYPEGT